MTFDEFVTEWRKQVREYGSGVPQEAIDMAEQAWEIATAAEREACEIAKESEREACAKKLELTPDDLRLMAGEMTPQEMRTVMAVLSCLRVRIRVRSNLELTGGALTTDTKRPA